jgi:hypothetical protein
MPSSRTASQYVWKISRDGPRFSVSSAFRTVSAQTGLRHKGLEARLPAQRIERR